MAQVIEGHETLCPFTGTMPLGIGSTPATLCMHDAINKFFMNTHLSLRGADDGKEDMSGCARLKLTRKGATATANGSHNDKLSLDTIGLLHIQPMVDV